MCGIIGVVSRNGEDIVGDIISGLEKLEYRGYDSAGVAVIANGGLCRVRAAGKLKNLKVKISEVALTGSIGIGHTRWATHGKATENNAHPMMTKDVALVHNGIIENYREIKFELQKDGYEFCTDTDTEIAAVFMQREMDRGENPRAAFRKMLQTVEGSYAFAAIFSQEPDIIFIAKNRSPLVVGFGEMMSIGSDPSALSGFCNEVVFLDDGEYAEISSGNVSFFDARGALVTKTRQPMTTDIINSGKGEYDHYMMKEIMEQPNAIRQTILHNKIDDKVLQDVSRILILACGSSYHAGMVARYWFERFLKLPTNVEIASEYRYRSPIIEDNTLVIAITQSGETIDTLEAIAYVRKNSNAKVAAIANVKNSAIARAADIVFYTEAGMEVGVASTKAFTAQLITLAVIAFSKNEFFMQELQNVPSLCEEVLGVCGQIQDIAEQIKDASSAIYLGRDVLFPIALEGALKLKEISYIHAEGFAAGEMKHGPIALIDDNIPVICMCPHNDLFEKTASNIEVSLARGRKMFVLTDEEGSWLLPNDVRKIVLPKVNAEFAPILYSIPLQLLAYYTALLRGEDVDKPRNLAKSVTVE